MAIIKHENGKVRGTINNNPTREFDSVEQLREAFPGKGFGKEYTLTEWVDYKIDNLRRTSPCESIFEERRAETVAFWTKNGEVK